MLLAVARDTGRRDVAVPADAARTVPCTLCGIELSDATPTGLEKGKRGVPG